LARGLYRWLGGTDGKRQSLLRSVHDVSDGGLFVAIAEGLIARGLGAQIDIPGNIDIWEWAFGEGFHTFVVSAKESESAILESEWAEFGVPFFRIGVTKPQPELEVRWAIHQYKKRFTIPVPWLQAAWRKENYWQ